MASLTEVYERDIDRLLITVIQASGEAKRLKLTDTAYILDMARLDLQHVLERISGEYEVALQDTGT